MKTNKKTSHSLAVATQLQQAFQNFEGQCRDTIEILERKYDISVDLEYRTPIQYLEETCPTLTQEESVFVVDLGNLIRQVVRWKVLLPRVHPYYAVKAFCDEKVLATLHLLGVNFDCASAGEIASVLKIGALPSEIIYANPQKGFRHLQYAKTVGVTRMTFDTEEELRKIISVHPEAELILRIASADEMSVMPFGYKFGCSIPYAKELIFLCAELGATLVGISFHVGSGCYDPRAYTETMNKAASLFEDAKHMGINMTVLDLGGGWPGDEEGMVLFSRICSYINPLLETLFDRSVEIIAEPGRYFSTAMATLATKVHGRREYQSKPQKIINDDGTTTIVPPLTEIQYFVGDGAYGSFNNTIWDHYVPVPRILGGNSEEDVLYSSTIFGPTCDSLDVIVKRIPFPKLELGKWIYFENMGAYTIAARSGFNGFDGPVLCYKMFVT